MEITGRNVIKGVGLLALAALVQQYLGRRWKVLKKIDPLYPLAILGICLTYLVYNQKNSPKKIVPALIEKNKREKTRPTSKKITPQSDSIDFKTWYAGESGQQCKKVLMDTYLKLPEGDVKEKLIQGIELKCRKVFEGT